MSAEFYDFPFHRVQNTYPEAASVQFGGNWVFTAKPNAPDKRRFELTYAPGMQYFILGPDSMGNPPVADMMRGDVETVGGIILNGQSPRSIVVDAQGDEILPTEEELIGQRNILALEAFYKRHQQWDTFMYPHYALGLIKVRFSQPLTMPRLVRNGNGVVESFSVQFEEMF